MEVTDTLAQYYTAVIEAVKSFIIQVIWVEEADSYSHNLQYCRIIYYCKKFWSPDQFVSINLGRIFSSWLSLMSNPKKIFNQRLSSQLYWELTHTRFNTRTLFTVFYLAQPLAAKFEALTYRLCVCCSTTVLIRLAIKNENFKCRPDTQHNDT